MGVNSTDRAAKVRIADWKITLADTIADNPSPRAVAPGHLLVKLPRSDVIEATSAKAVAERDRAEG